MRVCACVHVCVCASAYVRLYQEKAEFDISKSQNKRERQVLIY